MTDEEIAELRRIFQRKQEPWLEAFAERLRDANERLHDLEEAAREAISQYEFCDNPECGGCKHLRRLAILLSHVLSDDMDAWIEALRRLERLEKCEAALRRCVEVMGMWQENAWREYADAQDAARAALEEK